jgi:transcriptional regulator with XRE-family HTH domain
MNTLPRMREEKLLTGLGAAIRKRRIALKVSQEAFADLIGMHRAYYSAIERGERNLTLGTLHRVAKGLGVRMGDLMRDCNI